jgi:hypothetical protein
VTRSSAGAAVLLSCLAAGCSAGTPVAEVTGPPVAEQRVGLGEWDIRTEQRPLAAGPVELTVTNTGAAPHDLVLEQGTTRAATPVLRPGESAVLTAVLDGGRPVLLLCSVAGHRTQGMELELPVVPAEQPR